MVMLRFVKKFGPIILNIIMLYFVHCAIGFIFAID